MKKYGAVLFDLDNTLLDRRASFRRFAAAFIAEHFPDGNLPGARDGMIARMEALDNDGYGRKSAFYETLIAEWELGDVTAEALLGGHFESFERYATPYFDMADTLDALAGRYRLGLVTNGSSDGQHRKIDRLGIRGRFDAIVVSGDIGIHKPDARIFHMCLSAMGIAPERAVYVGDHYENDVLGAQGAGLDAIWFPCDAPTEEPSVPMIARLAELRDIL